MANLSMEIVRCLRAVLFLCGRFPFYRLLCLQITDVVFVHARYVPPPRSGPVCLCEFASAPERPIRVLKCRHALCSDCLESWAVHCTKAHLDPTRFGVTRGGQVVSWSPGPNCPLCKSQLKCVPDEDLREAVIAAIEQRGVAISTFIAYQSQASNSQAGAR